MRDPCHEDTVDRVRHLLTVTGVSEVINKMEHRTCQLQRIRLAVFLQELDDTPVPHPWGYHGILFLIYHYPDQLQYVWMRQTLPGDDLSTKVLQTVRLDRVRATGQSTLPFLYSGHRLPRNTV